MCALTTAIFQILLRNFSRLLSGPVIIIIHALITRASSCIHFSFIHSYSFNFLKGTLKPQSSGSIYCNMVIGTMVVDGWAVTFSTARRGLGGAPTRPGPSSLYQM